jgi:glycosyltransferase involved in cell wall biosynthesis
MLSCDAGVLVPPGDPAALAAALRGVLHDGAAAARLGHRAAERATRLYSLTAMVGRYAGIYATLLGRDQA